ncbi:MAG: class I SAM-dependent methyltransferase [Patescibacteria group bacterium]
MKNTLWDIYARCYESLEVFLPYQQLMEDVMHALPNDYEPRVLLDAACGTGQLLKRLQGRLWGWKLVGLDRSLPMLKVAQQQLRGSGLVLKHMDLNQKIPYDDSTFDVITCINALYALESPEQTLREFARILKPCGLLILVNPYLPRGIWIWANHFAQIISKRSLRGAVKTFLNAPQLLAISVINKIIAMHAKDQVFHFLHPIHLSSLVQKTGFQVEWETSHNYAGTCCMIRAVRADK